MLITWILSLLAAAGALVYVFMNYRQIKAMREGALDAYETLMIRMRHTDVVDRNCIVRHKGTWYQVESFHDDYQANTIQMTAVEMASQDVTLSH